MRNRVKPTGERPYRQGNAQAVKSQPPFWQEPDFDHGKKGQCDGDAAQGAQKDRLWQRQLRFSQFEGRHHGRDRKTAEREAKASKHLAAPGGDRQFGSAIVENKVDDWMGQTISRWLE